MFSDLCCAVCYLLASIYTDPSPSAKLIKAFKAVIKPRFSSVV